MRLGDLDALKEELSGEDYQTWTHEYGYAIPTEWVMNAIDNAPTVQPLIKPIAEIKVEAKPQGEWIEDSGNIACSNCHAIWLYRKTDFCPNCGADMWKGGKE